MMPRPLAVRSAAAAFGPLLAATLAAAAGPAPKPDPKPDFSKVPGVVVAHLPAAGRVYIGSPSVAVLDNGDYLVTHDLFGPGSTEHRSAVTRVYRSSDRGATWSRLGDVQGAFWSTVFAHRGAAYLLGTTRHHGDVVIRRSTDGGKTWTDPKDAASGLLRAGEFHCAPVPVVAHAGRLWRGMEDASGGKEWGKRYRAMMMSAPADADLLQAGNWTWSNSLPRDPAWLGGKFNAWLEGNAVVTPDGRIADLLRVDAPLPGGTAALVGVSDDGKTAGFDPASGFVPLPGGSTKFTVRRDPRDGAYWSLANYVPARHSGLRPASVRNTLALLRSADLRTWEVRCVLLHHPDRTKHGFQYPDWLFDGDDLIAVVRTAFDDGLGGAANFHDANFLTFHRIRNFRSLTPKDSVPTE